MSATVFISFHLLYQLCLVLTNHPSTLWLKTTTILFVHCSVGQQLGLDSAGLCWSLLGLLLPGAIHVAEIIWHIRWDLII